MRKILDYLGVRPPQPHVITNIGGKSYRIESDDSYLEHIRGAFEPNMVELFDSLVNPADTVLDIGANIGCTSILFGDRARKVLSFEPSPTTFAFLVRNVRASGLKNIVPRNVGLGKESGFFPLTYAPDNRAGGFVSTNLQASAGHRVERIEIVRGDAYLRDRADIGEVNFIKIDVEGFERDVIQGLRETIARFEPVIVLELNHWCLNAFQRISVPDFFDFLRSLFPYLYAVDANDVRSLHDTDDAYHVMYQHIVGGFRYPNIVAAFRADQLARFARGFGREIA